jgi:UDP-N-acetylmuramoylalanine--D-glutamate ligase
MDARVKITDIASEKGIGPFADKIRQMGMEMELGPHRPELFLESDLILISPGVPHDMEPILRAKEKGVTVMGEMELACRYIKEPIVAVTGTNGKTTTTALLGEMLNRSGIKPFVGGNIGKPLIGYVQKGEKADIIVAEVSSFQLDTIDTFCPKIAVLLNITDDHQDRYDNFLSYARSKGRVFLNQTEEDIAILNSADPTVRSISRGIRSQRLFFNADFESENGSLVKNDRIHVSLPPELQGRMKNNGSLDSKTDEGDFFDLSESRAMAGHQYQNASAACLAALAAGGIKEGIQSALHDFPRLPHRLEEVATINGIVFVNDSKATNVDATVNAINSFDAPIVLILGGLDKGGNFHELRDGVRQRVKVIVLMGESSKRFKATLGDLCPAIEVHDMEEAVFEANQSAAPRDVVLLSPACSSFDMYENYAQRGDLFRQLVRDLR